MNKLCSFALICLILCCLLLSAQDSATPLPYPIERQSAEQVEQNRTTPKDEQVTVFRVTVLARTTKAVNYRHRGGSTTVDFRGTDLMPGVGGHAKVDGKVGRLAISAELTHLHPRGTMAANTSLMFCGQLLQREGRLILAKCFRGKTGRASLM